MSKLKCPEMCKYVYLHLQTSVNVPSGARSQVLDITVLHREEHTWIMFMERTAGSENNGTLEGHAFPLTLSKWLFFTSFI